MSQVNNDVMDGPGATEAIQHLNELLRGEISAAETYRLAIDKVADATHSNAGLLRGIQVEHGRAAQGIRSRIKELGGDATDSSGAWGVWAKTVQNAMNVIGEDASLKALKDGEEHGLTEYRNAVNVVDASSAQLITNQLIPSQERHISILDQLMQHPVSG
jgi:hypothetical protein